jgi:hypothetical protein
MTVCSSIIKFVLMGDAGFAINIHKNSRLFDGLNLYITFVRLNLFCVANDSHISTFDTPQCVCKDSSTEHAFWATNMRLIVRFLA